MPKPPTKLAVQQPMLDGDTAAQHFRTWLNEVSRFTPIVDSGTPEGVVEALQYAHYIDESDPNTPAHWWKLLPEVGGDRSKGWVNAQSLESLIVNGVILASDVTADEMTSGSLTLHQDDSLQLEGDATAWDDLRTSLIGRRLNSTAGTVDYDYSENAVVFSGNGGITDTRDTVVFNFQLPHDAKPSELRVHMHYEQEDDTNRTFTLRYRIQVNGETKATSWTTVTADTDDSAFPYPGSGTINNILSIVSIDISNAGLSAVVECQMTRTDTESGAVNVNFIDAHYEKDALGSRSEFVK